MRRLNHANAVLNLWAQGVSAGAIVAALGDVMTVRAVASIVARAREDGDERAVLHCWRIARRGDGRRKPRATRYCGNQRRGAALKAAFPWLRLVEVIYAPE